MLIVVPTMIWATAFMPDDDDKNNQRLTVRRQRQLKGQNAKDTAKVHAQVVIEEDTIPDSLLHPRWKIQRTLPLTDEDLKQGPADLKRPDNIKQDVEYNDTLDRYVIGSKMGGTWLAAPTMMTMQEYLKWSEKAVRRDFFRAKNTEIFEEKGKEKFDFTDMHFELGPAEKIFGPGGVRIKTQGTAELKLGATLKDIDNPSLPVNNRKTTTIDFDEKINLNITGKVGDKVNLGLNYNTDATFEFDQQNLKLKYEGKEDEIIKLVEAGNVSFPSNSSLITGSSALFGIRTDLQFGKLKLQTVFSQKKSNSKSVSSKGGTSTTPFEIDAANYEENHHFFLSRFFRDIYDRAMSTLPTIQSGVNISRVEIWVTNKSGQTNNTRNIVALTDIGEGAPSKPALWGGRGTGTVPNNLANSEYSQMVSTYADARYIDQTTNILDGIADFAGGVDYEKLEKARLLNSSEYTVNTALGYVSLKSELQTDQVLAVAYEFTYNGQTYQVGEFASDITDSDKALFVKSLKNTSNNPRQANWDLMMKNVYYLASSVEKEKFRLDVKFQSDTAGVYLSYLPEPQVKDQMLIKVLGADRLDNNNKAHSNGFYDFVQGYTVANGRVFLPKAEPFGEHLYNYLTQNGIPAATAKKYCYFELYDSTKTVAKQIAEKDKYILQGQFKGTSENVIPLGATNVPQGSVVVTAGGVTLTEGSDYSVDYAAGEVRILNQSIIDAGTSVNVSLESNTDYGQQRKTMFGINWEYDFTKDFQMSGTLQHLTEQSLTTKVAMGAEPLNNTLWGVNLSWKKESQWLTNMLNKIPFLHVTAPSQIQLNAEFAQLIAGTASGTQDDASYIDDFESAKSPIDISTPTSWVMSSVPSSLAEDYAKRPSLEAGFHRGRLAWYTIDPLFTRRSSSLTPGHIKADVDQLSNYYVREVYVRELYPNRNVNTYNGETSTLPILNLAFYPEERGPYNFNYKELNSFGGLTNPKRSWGGMMRKLETNDFEAANIEYIEFWMLDPFLYTREDGTAHEHKGDLYFNLGEVSEDILPDGKKFHESGMASDATTTYTTTEWGKIPTANTVTYAFTTTSGSRAKQDVGLNGLTDEEEKDFESYQMFLNAVNTTVTNDSARSYILEKDPANDNYHYYRGRDWDDQKASILQRYKYINNPQGNSPDSEMRNESYDTSYKMTPDVEDINQDYTLNEYEKYFQYHVSIDPDHIGDPDNYCVDKRETTIPLRNGKTGKQTWYQFRIPLNSSKRERIGSISDFTSIRFMRMFMTNFEKPIVLRLGSLALVRGEWRQYEQNLNTAAPNTGELAVSSVSIEENNTKTPVNYVLPPGISRAIDPTQTQLTENDEQALAMLVTNMSNGDAKAVYRNTTLDLRNYKRLQMYVHANALEQNTTNLRDNELAVFIRLGSDYKSNYYEYEIPLKLTPAGVYSTYSLAGCEAVWPRENMLDIRLSLFTALKKARNMAKGNSNGDMPVSFNMPYTAYDEANPANKITVMGNPSLGEVKTLIIGIRNNSVAQKSGEVWINELRLLEAENSGGWAASGNLNVQLSDFGSVTATGKYISEGFGGLEEGIASRTTDNFGTYSITTNLELGKFFPDKAKVNIPLYYSYTREKTSPKYNPLDTDMLLDDALDAAANQHERDSINSLATTKSVSTNFSLSGVKFGIATKRHPMPYDPANFSFSYSHSHNHTEGETTVYENEDQWRGSINYSWTPVYKPFEPFKKIKSKAKSYDILKKMQFNWLPQNISFNTDMNRSYYELQERDLENLGAPNSLQASFSSQFLWNRNFSLRWDLTKNLHMSFQSATRAEIEEPYTQVNKDLYPERYEAWKDSVWTSIKKMGTPLDYSQQFTASYQLPLNLIPIFSWINSDASYNSSYHWARGTEQEDGTNLGNTISMNRTLTLNGTFNMEKLYDQIPFLKKTNERFKKAIKKVPEKQKTTAKKTDKNADSKDKTADSKDKNAANNKNSKDDKNDKNKQLPKNSKTFEREITINADTSIVITHGKKSKRLIVVAKDESGKVIPIKYKSVDDNKISIVNKLDTAVKMKVMVTAKEPLENFTWYRTAQSAARFLMMIRSVGVTYRNQYSLALPGFMPSVGDVFGQKKNDGLFAPGVDFAFGFVGDSYVDRAQQNGWLLGDTTVASPAASSKTEDLQIKMTLEPFRNFKIDLNASRTETRQRSVQYMYAGNPTTLSGTFTMTTVSIKSAIEGSGNADNGFKSKSFENFCKSLPSFRERVEAQYAGARYPANTIYEGKEFTNNLTGDPNINTGVDPYSADVMVPAFLKAYTGIDGLDIFPGLLHLLPNWSIKYSGLSNLTFFQNLFKSVNINHSYKSVYAVGSYSSYSTFMEYMGNLGFVTDNTSGTTLPRPSSMFNVSQVSINEAFSPLLGVDVTFKNGLTAKVEYKTTRVLNLSMSSVQLNETSSHDWVLGFGYKLNDFKFSSLFGRGGPRTIKKSGTGTDDDTNGNGKKSTKKTSKRTFNHDLNLRLDVSLRDQAAITRDIATMTSAASSGNKAFKMSMSADYSISRLMTMSFYYDRQTNQPLLTSSSYPTTTQDFGLSIKFSLTR